jgi:hypothetical protein
MNIRAFAILLAFSTFLSCEKYVDPPVIPPVFEVYVNNSFPELNARFAVFVSDQNTGETRAFRWVPAEDTLLLQVPNSNITDRFDCTVLKLTTLIAPGTGIRDTFLALTTYTDIGNGAQINLRDQEFQQATTLKFTLTGMNTLDSIVVPDAYAISRPQPNNNYTGEYLCYHSGKCWVRILVNGDPFWRFVRFDDLNGATVDASTLNANLFLSILAPPLQLNFPFISAWDYKVDGLVDTSNLEFFPLSRQLLVPGSPIPVISSANIFEPVNNDVFEPNRPYNGVRLQLRGTEAAAGGYTYTSDHFYSTIPTTLPVPDFDLSPTILSDNRLIAVACSGDFDLLAFSRVRSGYQVHLNITWEVVTKPRNGIVSYRLPDVPTPLGDLYLPLKNYDFNAGVKARAERYELPLNYEKIVRQHLGANDVLWQARAGYLGREESF